MFFVLHTDENVHDLVRENLHALELMITSASNEESNCLMWRALENFAKVSVTKFLGLK